jgi:hypothetical protein
MADTDFNPDDFDDDRAIQQEMRHAASQICYGVVKCIHCGVVFGSCCDVQFQLGGSMLPQPRGSAVSSPAAQGQGGGGQQQRTKQGYDYVHVDMLKGKGKIRCLILGVEETPEPKPGQRKFSDVRVKLQMPVRGILLLGLSIEGANPNYQIFADALGLEPMDWINREFWLFATEANFEGKQFPRVEVIDLSETQPAPAHDEAQSEAASAPVWTPAAPVVAARRAQPRR